ncbi:MAG: transporter permease [Thermoleophilia bacterium]|nr:transporter permease [Thermoleophilia bacterium]
MTSSTSSTSSAPVSAGAVRPPLRRLHSVRAVGGLVRSAILEELQYRSNFWIYLINAVVELGLSLLTLSIVFAHVDHLNGWSRDDLLVLLGAFFLMQTVVQGIVHPSVSQLVQDIRTGNFDHRLLKPVDAQLVSVVQRIDIWRLVSAALGLGLTVAGLVRGGDAPSVGQVAAWLGMLACGAVIAGSFWSLISSVTFYTVQGEGILWTLDDMFEHVRWPIDIFPTALRVTLSSVFPLGVAITVPAQALTGRLDLAGAGLAVGLAVAFATFSRLAWNRAVRRYEGASA